MQIHFRRTWKVGLVALAAMIGGASLAQAAIVYDVRVVSASGGATMMGPKSVEVAPGTAGDIVAELWGVVTGANADLTDDRVNSYAMKFLTSGPLRANLSRPDAPGVGIANTHRDPGWGNGTVQDLDADGDMDIGGTAATTAGYAIGRSLAGGAPYSGQGPAAEFMMYRFNVAVPPGGSGEALLNVQRHAGPLNVAWAEDGVQKSGSTVGAVITFGAPVDIEVIPEPGTIALALLGVAGVAMVIRRRKS